MSDQNELAPQPPVGFDEMLRDALIGEHPDYHSPFELTRRLEPELDLAPYEVDDSPIALLGGVIDGLKDRIAELESKLELSDRACRAAEEVMMDAQLCTPAQKAEIERLEEKQPDQNSRAQVVEALELFAALTPNERDVVMFLADDEHLDLAALSTILEAIAPLDENYRGELTEYADDPVGRCDLCGKKAPMAVTDRGAVCSWGCDEL
jgi:hypothetical protein